MARGHLREAAAQAALGRRPVRRGHRDLVDELLGLQAAAREGSAEKWLQEVSGYYFAASRLQDVSFPFAREDGGSRFTFYFDPDEPLNSEDPYRNVNPEVIYCSFPVQK